MPIGIRLVIIVSSFGSATVSMSAVNSSGVDGVGVVVSGAGSAAVAAELDAPGVWSAALISSARTAEVAAVAGSRGGREVPAVRTVNGGSSGSARP